MKMYPCCPKCGESYYQENYSVSTAMYWAPVYKNGVLISENPNTTTTYCTYCTCCNCGHSFSYSNKDKAAVSTSLDCNISREDAGLTEVSVL